VYSHPKIGILSTGNELVEPDEKPAISQIRNSNGYQILAQVQQLGYSPEYLGIAKDNESYLLKLLSHYIRFYDILIISGGVSVGDYDFVPLTLKQLGVNILFHGLEAKPGKHLLFDKKDNPFFFGLPGNPVSSFIQFELLIKPMLLKPISDNAIIQKIPIAENYFRKKADVVSFIPAILTDNHMAMPIEYHGSAHIHSYCKAQVIIEIPKGIHEIKKGELVNVRPI